MTAPCGVAGNRPRRRHTDHVILLVFVAAVRSTTHGDPVGQLALLLVTGLALGLFVAAAAMGLGALLTHLKNNRDAARRAVTGASATGLALRFGIYFRQEELSRAENGHVDEELEGRHGAVLA